MAKANYDLPEDKIAAVMKLSGATSKKDALIIALDSYLRKKELEQLIQSHGKVSLSWTKKSLRRYRS